MVKKREHGSDPGDFGLKPLSSRNHIIGVLKEHQAGVAVADLCRKHGISDATFYKWRSRYGGIKVSDAKRLRGLEEENARLSRARWRDLAGRQRWIACRPGFFLTVGVLSHLFHGLFLHNLEKAFTAGL